MRKMPCITKTEPGRLLRVLQLWICGMSAGPAAGEMLLMRDQAVREGEIIYVPTIFLVVGQLFGKYQNLAAV